MKFNRIIVALAVAVMVVTVGTGVALDQGALTVNITAPANNSTHTAGQPINFTASFSNAVGGGNITWDFSDGTNANGTSFTKTFASAGTYTAEATVTDFDSNTDTDTITIVVNPASTQLVISNVRVTDVTQTSAIVRWDTNLPANSRVIYDTVSHPSITGASAPDYGYANSTATFDNSPKVTSHAVTLTNLSAQTKYYYRVISEE